MGVNSGGDQWRVAAISAVKLTTRIDARVYRHHLNALRATRDASALSAPPVACDAPLDDVTANRQ